MERNPPENLENLDNISRNMHISDIKENLNEKQDRHTVSHKNSDQILLFDLNFEIHTWKEISDTDKFNSNNNLLKTPTELMIEMESYKLKNLENIDITNVAPYTIFCLLFTENMWWYITTQKNLYAEQEISKAQDKDLYSDQSRPTRWKIIMKEEI